MKHLLCLLLLLSSIVVSAQIKIAPDGHAGPTGPFPATWSIEAKGGLHKYTDTTNANTVLNATSRKDSGMIVYTTTDNKYWSWDGGKWVFQFTSGQVGNQSWQEVTNVGNTTTNSTVQGASVTSAPTLSAILFGDSYFAPPTFGITYSDAGIATLFTKGSNMIQVNMAIAGTTMQRNAVGDSSGFDRIYRIPAYSSFAAGSIIVINYGINDLRQTGGAYDTTTCGPMYRAFIDACIAQGWPLSQIKILTPNYIGNSATLLPRQTQYQAMIAGIAAAKGVQRVDSYTAELNTGNPAQFMLADSLHLTRDGHYFVAQLMLNEISAGNKVASYLNKGRYYGYNSVNLYKYNASDSAILNVQNNGANALSVNAGVNGNQVNIGTATNGPGTSILNMGGSYGSNANLYGRDNMKFFLYNVPSSGNGFVGFGVTPGGGSYFKDSTTKIFHIANTVLAIDSMATLKGPLNAAAGGSAVFANGVQITNTGTINYNSLIRASTTTGNTISSAEGTGIPHSLTFQANAFTNVTNISGIRVNHIFSPTVGSSAWASMRITPTINQTGTNNGVTAGLVIEPTLTSATDFRAVMTLNNTGHAFYASGTAPSLFNGDVRIPNASTAASNDSLLSIAPDGTIRKGSLNRLGVASVNNKMDTAYLNGAGDSLIYEINGRRRALKIGGTSTTPALQAVTTAGATSNVNTSFTTRLNAGNSAASVPAPGLGNSEFNVFGNGYINSSLRVGGGSGINTLLFSMGDRTTNVVYADAADSSGVNARDIIIASNGGKVAIGGSVVGTNRLTVNGTITSNGNTMTGKTESITDNDAKVATVEWARRRDGWASDVQNVSSSITLSLLYHVLVCNGSGITISIPTSDSGNEGKIYRIVNKSTSNTVALLGMGSGQPTSIPVLGAGFNYIEIMSDGTEWIQIN